MLLLTMLLLLLLTILLLLLLFSAGLIIVGRMRLASLVSYLPMPVVGGYLAFIGLFCLEAGLSLCTGKSINQNPSSWIQMADSKAITMALPGISSGLLLCFISHKITHSAALPVAMMLMPLLFYLVVVVAGVSVEELQTSGWLGAPTASTSVLHVFEVFDVSLVRWDLMPQQIPTWLGMFFVVAFSSCLDVRRVYAAAVVVVVVVDIVVVVVVVFR